MLQLLVLEVVEVVDWCSGGIAREEAFKYTCTWSLGFGVCGLGIGANHGNVRIVFELLSCSCVCSRVVLEFSVPPERRFIKYFWCRNLDYWSCLVNRCMHAHTRNILTHTHAHNTHATHTCAYMHTCTHVHTAIDNAHCVYWVRLEGLPCILRIQIVQCVPLTRALNTARDNRPWPLTTPHIKLVHHPTHGQHLRGVAAPIPSLVCVA